MPTRFVTPALALAACLPVAGCGDDDSQARCLPVAAAATAPQSNVIGRPLGGRLEGCEAEAEPVECDASTGAGCGNPFNPFFLDGGASALDDPCACELGSSASGSSVTEGTEYDRSP